MLSSAVLPQRQSHPVVVARQLDFARFDHFVEEAAAPDRPRHPRHDQLQIFEPGNHNVAFVGLRALALRSFNQVSTRNSREIKTTVPAQRGAVEERLHLDGADGGGARLQRHGQTEACWRQQTSHNMLYMSHYTRYWCLNRLPLN